MHYTWNQKVPDAAEQQTGISLRCPDGAGRAQELRFQFTAEPGENHWQINVPDEFWAEGRKKLADASADKSPEKAATPDAKE